MTLLPLLIITLSTIQIDGSFNDWAEGELHHEDESYIYKIIEVTTKSCLQQLPEQKVVEIGDYTVFFSPKGKGYGVSCKLDDKWISPYEAGVVFAPTTASTKFELRVNKQNSNPKKPFSCVTKGDFRVVSWNVQFGNLLDDIERGTRILRAIKPDVLLIQELGSNDTVDEFEEFLNESLEGTWHAIMTPVHGTKRHRQLRSAIATSLNISNVSTIENLKAISCFTELEEEKINFYSLHLRCCGGPDSDAEKQRVEEAKKIKTSIENQNPTHLIVAGDWNLVGTTEPIDIVKTDELAVVNAYQPDGLLNATWSDVTSSFTPGRLDWMLYSPKTLKVVNCFVLDTADLDTNTLNNKNLSVEDTAELSDHLPLVADFVFIK